MTCKLCGKNLITQVADESPYLAEAIEEMDKLPCDELYTEYHITPLSFRYDAAKLILQRRGHDEVS